MTQNVPEFQFDDDALKLRQFSYEYWCAHGHGPNLRAAHEGTGLSRQRIIDAYKQLDLGVICVVDQDSQNFNLLKAQPFSSFPSQVEVHINGKFHCSNFTPRAASARIAAWMSSTSQPSTVCCAGGFFLPFATRNIVPLASNTSAYSSSDKSRNPSCSP